MPGPDHTSANPRASSTRPSNPVPAPWTKPSQSAAASLSFIPGRRRSWTCSIASAASSLAIRIRSISCSVLIARASREQGRRVVDLHAPRVEPVVRVRRRLADHAVGRLRAQRELEPDALVAALRIAACAASIARGTGGRGSSG